VRLQELHAVNDAPANGEEHAVAVCAPGCGRIDAHGPAVHDEERTAEPSVVASVEAHRRTRIMRTYARVLLRGERWRRCGARCGGPRAAAGGERSEADECGEPYLSGGSH